MSRADAPDWERVISAAAHLQRILPDAVLVGGTAAALYARHRMSSDADHVLGDLRARFDEVLMQLEAVAGWKTARIQRPVQILGSLDGIETGVRQLIRTEPLEATQIDCSGVMVTLPTAAEMLRIKAVLILRRNATRDYLDFVALCGKLGEEAAAAALASFDRLYPQDNGESPLQQLQVQLSSPLPYDLEQVNLGEYKQLRPELRDWQLVRQRCADAAFLIMDRLIGPADDAAGASVEAAAR